MAQVIAKVGSTSNSYRIVAKLAVGGMAEIFLVRGSTATGVERYCVLKRVLPERAGTARFVQMFLDEARLATQLQHPNIASVHDIGMLDDSYFYTMEYVHGETVQSLVRRALESSRPLPLACVLTILAGAAAGLHHAHERNAPDGRSLGIVHRDVSPSNVMVSYEGNVKLVDFGVAMASDRRTETNTGVVKGKIGYLSPEQCRCERLDRRSDLFSLGIVAWEMLTGERLYRRASEFETMLAIVEDFPARPSSRRPGIPSAVDDAVLRMLTKSLSGRFQTAAEVIEAIENAAVGAGLTLSTAAVSRMMKDLFGRRVEPWLELEQIAADAVTLVSRPLPEELVASSEAPEESAPGIPAGPRSGTASMEASASLVRRVADFEDTSTEVAAAPASEVTLDAEPAVDIDPSSDDASSDITSLRRSSTTLPVRLLAAAALVAAVVGIVALSLETEPAAAFDRRAAPGDLSTARPTVSATVEPVHSLSPAASPPSVAVRSDSELAADKGPAAPTPEIGAARNVALSPSGGAPRRARTELPHPAAAPPRGTPGPSNRRPVAVEAAPRVPGPSQPPALDAVRRKFEEGDYAGVVATCGLVTVTGAIADLCTRAACRTHDPANARLWLPFNPAGQVERLVHYCSELGIAIRSPALDCSSDPLDCR